MMKGVSKIFYAIAFALLFMAAGCSKVKDIKLVSCSVDSVTPIGLRGVRASLSVTVDNPAMDLNLSDIRGVIFYKGSKFATFTAEDLSVHGNKVYSYPLVGTVMLDESISLFNAVGIFSGSGLTFLTATVEADVKLNSGVGKHLKYENLSLKELLDNSTEEKI